ncbi:cytochrome P450 [Amycolatopsis sp. NPDC059657]|uniref:cytochrome P450 family protein n=1 Tax=Amycolatopsis sp. NPDC059657 TaxID=3346899 RepID=UPI00366CEDD8
MTLRDESRTNGHPETPPTFTQEIKNDPWAFFSDLRENHPVARLRHPDGFDFFAITRYDLVRDGLSDLRFSQNFDTLAESSVLALEREDPLAPLNKNLLGIDPPDHTRLRRLATPAFHRQKVEQLHETAAKTVTSLLAALPPDEPVDLIEQFATKVPATVLSELFDIDVDDWADFRRRGQLLMTPPWGQTHADVAVIKMPMLDYCVDLVRRRRKNPGEDIISSMVQARDGSDKLSEDELVGMTFLILMTSYQTTYAFLTNAVLALLERPDALKTVLRNKTVQGPILEELLRFAGPVETAPIRFATEQVEIEGRIIPAKAPVSLLVSAANRDEKVFHDPHDLVFDRRDNPHLSFGHGIHFCLGTVLAKLEAITALDGLLKARPGLTLAADPGSLVQRPGIILRVPTELPVLLGPAA